MIQTLNIHCISGCFLQQKLTCFGHLSPAWEFAKLFTASRSIQSTNSGYQASRRPCQLEFVSEFCSFCFPMKSGLLYFLQKYKGNCHLQKRCCSVGHNCHARKSVNAEIYSQKQNYLGFSFLSESLLPLFTFILHTGRCSYVIVHV